MASRHRHPAPWDRALAREFPPVGAFPWTAEREQMGAASDEDWPEPYVDDETTPDRWVEEALEDVAEEYAELDAHDEIYCILRRRRRA